jgi:hypothetical protein
MSQLPRLPEDESDGTDRPRASAGLIVGVVVAIAIVALLVVLHLSGALGAGVHG